MSKLALCIMRADLAELTSHIPAVLNNDTPRTKVLTIIPPGFFDLKTVLMPRDICEHDSSYLQLLPYISILGTADTTPAVYTYRRSSASGEGRLHGKHSIGFGGHIEEDVTDKCTMADIIINCLLREVQEEIGMDLSEYQDVFRNGIENALMIYTDVDDVGEKHLGIGFGVTLNNPQSFTVDETEILDHGLVAIADTVIKPTVNYPDGGYDFEVWSEMVLGLIIARQNRYLANEVAAKALREYMAATDYVNTNTVTDMRFISDVINTFDMQ